MKRRDFLAASCFAGMAPMSSLAEAAAQPSGKEFYELRLVHFASAEKQQAAIEFFGKAAIPAMNRIGVGPIGVLKHLEGDSTDLFVLLPHKSLESAVTVLPKLAADAEFLNSGEAFISAPFSDPAYTRVESSLMLAFDELPKLEVPTTKETRVLQLRIYESHNVAKGQKKIEMFNGGGEIALFKRTGLNPVFFGETLVGDKMPNLTYMLSFDDMDALKKNWETFVKHPEWKRISSDPQYADTVSNITNILLRPAACSQI